MNRRKEKLKKSECIRHRQVQLDKALDGLIEGTIPPEYVSRRWEKLKQIKYGRKI